MIEAIRQRYWDVRRAIAQGRASNELSRLNLKFIPWSRYALQPASVMTLLNEVLINRRNTVVEFGCGVSTLYLAKVLFEQGGRLVSFEDNADWAAQVRSLVIREGLSGTATIIDAPLGRSQLARGNLQWYDEAIVNSAIDGLEIDLALVDGPTAFDPGMGLARYPAFPAIASRLAERCAVVLDDISRPGEQEIVAGWRRLPGFDLQMKVATIANFAVLRRGSYFDSGY